MTKKNLSQKSKAPRGISAEEFDRKFDAGEDILEHLDLSAAKVVTAPDIKPHKVNVDFPSWVVAALDEEAGRLGIARQALIKIWIAERIEQQRTRQAAA